MNSTKRVFNFSAGPAVLPVEDLQEAQSELLDYQGSGMSIMESSHRGKEYDAVHEEAQANVRRLLDVLHRLLQVAYAARIPSSSARSVRR